MGFNKAQAPQSSAGTSAPNPGTQQGREVRWCLQQRQLSWLHGGIPMASVAVQRHLRARTYPGSSMSQKILLGKLRKSELEEGMVRWVKSWVNSKAQRHVASHGECRC